MLNQNGFMVDNKFVSIEEFTKEIPKKPLTLRTMYGNLVNCKIPEDADKYKTWMITCYEKWFDYSFEKATEIIEKNIGYYAGYFNAEKANRILKLFKTSHPVFGDNIGNIPPEFAYKVGVEAGKET